MHTHIYSSEMKVTEKRRESFENLQQTAVKLVAVWDVFILGADLHNNGAHN